MAEGRDGATGKFAKGYKGGPGRPRNTRDEYKAILHNRAPELLDRCIDMAMGGDVTCMRLCMERIYPVHTQAMAELSERLEALQARLEDMTTARAA